MGFLKIEIQLKKSYFSAIWFDPTLTLYLLFVFRFLHTHGGWEPNADREA